MVGGRKEQRAVLLGVKAPQHVADGVGGDDSGDAEPACLRAMQCSGMRGEERGSEEESGRERERWSMLAHKGKQSGWECEGLGP